MGFLQRFWGYVRTSTSDENFLVVLKRVETWVSKILSIAMVGVLFTVVIELCLFLTIEIIFNNSFAEPDRFFSVTIIKIFGSRHVPDRRCPQDYYF
jgi:hypothetical protein